MKNITQRLLACLLAVLMALSGTVPALALDSSGSGSPPESVVDLEDESVAILTDDEIYATPGTTDEEKSEPEPESEPIQPEQNTDEEDVIAQSEPGEPYYEIVRAPDLEYGRMTAVNPVQRTLIQPMSANIPRSISTLNVNDTVMVPLENGLTLKFRVMAKDHYKYGPGVVLMSTQTTATVKYTLGTTINGPNTFYYYFPLSGNPAHDGGAFVNSLARDYLVNTFYNELHTKLKPLMKRAAQSEDYRYNWWGYSTHSYMEMWIDFFAQRSNSDFVFIPSSYEVSRSATSSHAEFGATWGPNTTWSVSNATYFHLRDRYGSNNVSYGTSGNYAENWLALYASTVNSSGTVGVDRVGKKPDVAQEIMVPCILLDNSAMIIEGANGPEITFYSPPTEPGAVSGPAFVNVWQTPAITYTWGASTDPGGSGVSYVVETSINGGGFAQAAITPNASHTHTIGSGDNNVRIRVRARNAYGIESGYVTSDYTYITHNSPPTTPTNLVPDATLVNSWETGTIEYTWDASYDANGDTITYIVEHNINNAGWVQVATTSELGYTHAISSVHNSVQIRVQATDGKEPSGYAASALTTVVHDTAYPSISVTASPDPSSGWTSSDAVITVVMANAVSPLDRLEVPEGVEPTGTAELSGKTASRTFTVSTAGSYAFTVYNKAGLSATESVDVGNVDQEPPEIAYVMSVPDGEFTNGNVDIHFTLADSLSGLQRFITPAGAVELSGNSASYTYTATQNGAPTFMLLDNVFNSTSVNIIVNMIDRIKPMMNVDAALKQWNNQSGTNLSISANDDYSGVSSVRSRRNQSRPSRASTAESMRCPSFSTAATAVQDTDGAHGRATVRKKSYGGASIAWSMDPNTASTRLRLRNTNSMTRSCGRLIRLPPITNGATTCFRAASPLPAAAAETDLIR